MIVADQSEAIAFLRAHASRCGEPVETVTTHGSVVFLAGDRAFKLKRAVRFPYLDFSSPEKRLASCRQEIALNRRTAPSYYLAARRITRTGGALACDGVGELVDAFVEMRRFPADALLDTLVERGEATPATMERLARAIAAFHRDAATDEARSGAQAVEAVIAINDAALRDCGLVDEGEAARFTGRFREALAHRRALLDARGRAGSIRRCHGDLILRNIFLDGEKPTLFDCIDFNDDIATIDVLYDLAFLLMDLAHRGRGDFANLVMNRYLDETGDDAGAGLLPFFMALRAAIRAHVGATRAGEQSGEEATRGMAEARAYLCLAQDLLAPSPPRLVAVGGLSGTGKSTVAALLAERLGKPPGARHLNSDRLRKHAFGVSAGAHLPPEAYAAQVSREVYSRMRETAETLLRGGASVVLDAVFDRGEERDAVEALAARLDTPFTGLWLEAPEAVLRARVATRSRARSGAAEDNPSDADLAVLAAQIARATSEVSWRRMDADRAPQAIRDEALAALDEGAQGSAD